MKATKTISLHLISFGSFRALLVKSQEFILTIKTIYNDQPKNHPLSLG